jgi:hypothetical protein
MSKIIILPDNDIWLTYSWSNNNHGICGHTFEVIDYYFILKDYFKVGIFLAEDITWETFQSSITSKYSVSSLELEEIKSNTVFADRPSLVRGKNILFTDGGVVNNQSKTLIFDNIFYFACGNKEIADNNKENVYVLQDNRVYSPVKRNGINYKKKILFNKLKRIGPSKDNALVYATKNCRDVDNFEELLKYGKPLLAITNEENTQEDTDNIKFVIPPVEHLFEQFSTYIYTPVKRKWDCSPRFLAECKYYGKEIIFHNIDYWSEDHGLYWRNWDIENDFESIVLDKNDEIIDIIKGIINASR